VIRAAALILLVPVFPTLLSGQQSVPATGPELAAADRVAWAAGLLAACDTLPVDSTWRSYVVPDSHVTVRLPSALGERGDILRGRFHDAWPAVPTRDYSLEQYDPITSRLLQTEFTLTIRCHTAERRGAYSLSSIWVAGSDYRAREDEAEGIWYVIGSWHSGEQWLIGMSRDLWGARALVTAMRHTEFPRRSRAP
jgi:hypothetical protein